LEMLRKRVRTALFWSCFFTLCLSRLDGAGTHGSYRMKSALTERM
jgi:hypothetical protein